MKGKLQKFIRWVFHPKMDGWYLIRVIVLASAAFLFFRFLCMPMVLDGASMDPNYHSGTLNFCWTPAFWFREPKRGDVVVLKYGGDEVMLLKRVIGLPGDTVEFRKGVLYLNGTAQTEPYVRNRVEPWDLSPRKVSSGHIYVVGDNRSMPMYQHKFGEIRKNRVKGTLLL